MQHRSKNDEHSEPPRKCHLSGPDIFALTEIAVKIKVASLKPLSRLLSVAHVHIHACTFIALEGLTPGNLDTCWNKRETCAVEVQVEIPNVPGDTADSHA